MWKLFRDQTGGIAIYSAVFSIIAIGGAVLTMDYGRMTVLRAQMQNRADAAAMAGAVYLDGSDGARARATDVATNAATQSSSITIDANDLSVSAVNYYSQLQPNAVVATTDQGASFIEVVLVPKTVNYMFRPVLNLLSANGATSGQMSASAVAGPDPYICEVPPLMLCDPGETDPTLDLGLAENIGRQFRLKSPQGGGSPWVAGNFGLLALPDGSSGAAAIQGALAAVIPADCYELDVTTAPGSKTNQVRNGMNARFDLPGGLTPPAPNVINFPRDPDIIADPDVFMGNGAWDSANYWLTKHGVLLPGILAGATRYQVYLYEQNIAFARNGTQTLVPPPTPLPTGFATVTPPGVDLVVAEDEDDENDPDFDGVPSQTVASNGQARRLVQVAVLQCQALGINGSGTYPTEGNYVEMFITETVQSPPNAAIYGELVRRLTPIVSPQFHANVRLVQ